MADIDFREDFQRSYDVDAGRKDSVTIST